LADPYSERFCLAKRPGFPLDAFTVPAGRRAIVRSLSYSGYLTTSPAIWLAIAGVYVFVALPQAATFGGNLDLYQVAYEGELIVVDATAAAGDVGAACSGYLLTDVGGGRDAAQLPAPPSIEPHPPLEPEA
jgi:hypothetical protein